MAVDLGGHCCAARQQTASSPPNGFRRCGVSERARLATGYDDIEKK